jgi:hypothetical protein
MADDSNSGANANANANANAYTDIPQVPPTSPASEVPQVPEVPEETQTFVGIGTTEDYKPCTIWTNGKEKFMEVITVEKLYEIVGKDQMKRMFPSLMAKDGKIYMLDSSQTSAIKLDIDFDDEVMAQAQAEKYGILWPQLNSLIKLAKKEEPIVPEEYQDKYCLIFGGKVFFSADTYEEILVHREEVHLDFKEYIPPQKE